MRCGTDRLWVLQAKARPRTSAPLSSLGTRGLTSSEVAERVAQGKVNVNTELKTKSVKELVIENTCTLFNLINIILAALVIVTGAWKNLTFLGVVVLNTGIGIVQALRSKRMVDKLTLLASKCASRSRRSAGRTSISMRSCSTTSFGSAAATKIPADAVVVEGEGQVNESLLTGESDQSASAPAASS